MFPTEGTVLLHISQAIKQDQVIHYKHVGYDYGIWFPLGTRQRICKMPEGIVAKCVVWLRCDASQTGSACVTAVILSPFSIALAMSVAQMQRFEDQVM